MGRGVGVYWFFFLSKGSRILSRLFTGRERELEWLGWKGGEGKERSFY